MKNFIVLLFIFSISTVGYGNQLDKTEVTKFVNTMNQKYNYDKSELFQLFDEVKIEKRIKSLIKKAPERKLTWNGCTKKDKKCINYRGLFVNKNNIRGVKEFINANRYILDKAYYEFGVPREIITAIIGIETKYGKHLGKFKTFDTLASLSLSENRGRRSGFYRSELENFLLLCKENKFDPRNIYGSYAGALGKPQFISSSYRNYAIDFDKDGEVNLWNSDADIVGSVANYLHKNGWKRDGKILTNIENYKNNKNVHSISQKTYKPHTSYKLLNELDIESLDYIEPNEKLSIIRKLEGNQNVYSLGHNNFYTITRYNRSRLYALAVFTLAEELKK